MLKNYVECSNIRFSVRGRARYVFIHYSFSFFSSFCGPRNFAPGGTAHATSLATCIYIVILHILPTVNRDIHITWLPYAPINQTPSTGYAIKSQSSRAENCWFSSLPLPGSEVWRQWICSSNFSVKKGRPLRFKGLINWVSVAFLSAWTSLALPFSLIRCFHPQNCYSLDVFCFLHHSQ